MYFGHSYLAFILHFSNDSEVNDLVTWTVTLMLKKLLLPRGIVFYNHILL